MLTLRNDLARAFAAEVARNDLDAVTIETLRAGIRLAGCLLDAAEAEPEALPGIGELLGADPAPSGLERHARGMLAAGYQGLRAATSAPPEARADGLAAAADALFRFCTWCRHAGHYAVSVLITKAAVAAWPATVGAERRLWLAYFGASSDVLGAPDEGDFAPAPVVADTLEAQVRHAGLRDMLPLPDFLRGLHEVNCGRFAAAERIALSIIRRGRRSGNRGVVVRGLTLATTAVGRQGRDAEAAAFALELVQIEEAPHFMRVQALVNVGVAFQSMGLFEPSLEAYAASLDWHRRHDEHPAAFVRVLVLRQVLEIFALRGDRPEFLALYQQLAATPLMPFDRVFFHRDAATGFMRFGDVDAALSELAKAQAVAERHGYHYDWFAIEGEIQKLRNVHSQGRDVAQLERSHAALVQSARATWQTLETDRRVLTGSA